MRKSFRFFTVTFLLAVLFLIPSLSSVAQEPEKGDSLYIRNIPVSDSGKFSMFSYRNSVPGENILKLLQGREPGLDITGSGMPGDYPSVRIRGFSSFSSNTPLFVVDGMPVSDISFINPGDVKSVSILKDAGSAAIYGGRASAGVITVTTMEGAERLRVNYDMKTGIQFPGKGTRDQLLDAREYANLQWLVYRNDNTVEINPLYGPSSAANPQLPSWAGNTDWYAAMTKPALLTDHHLSVSDGGENFKVYGAVGYFRQNGIVIYTNTEKISSVLNSEFSLWKKHITIGERVCYTVRDFIPTGNLGDDSPILTGPYRSQPIIPVTMTQQVTGLSRTFQPGEWGGTGLAHRLGNTLNEVAELTRNRKSLSRDYHFTGQGYLDIMIIDGLNIRSSYGNTNVTGKTIDYLMSSYESSENRPASQVSRSSGLFKDWLWTATASFTKKFGSQKISAVAGYELMKYGSGNAWSSVRLIEANILIDTARFSFTAMTMKSLYFKAAYELREKYLLSFTLRNDISSQFGEAHRNGLFPSVGGGWIISRESFLAGNGWLTFLKLRGSFGITGKGLPVLSPGEYIADPNVGFEKVAMTNAGFDAELFSGRAGITFDWYSKYGRDLLLAIPLPGPASTVMVDNNSMKTKGMDLKLSYSKSLSEFAFSGTLVLGAYRNEVTGIAGGNNFIDQGYTRIGSTVRIICGQPVSSFYGYRILGLFQSAGEVLAAPAQDGAAPGFFRYADTDKDGSISNGDRITIGNPNPAFTYGLDLSLKWKNFELCAFLYGSQGNDIFNFTKWWTDFWPSFQGQKSKKLLYESWTPQRKNATVPKASNTSNFSTNTAINSYYIENGSYLRLKSLQLSYSLPAGMLERMHISMLRVYLQAVNLFTLTKYSGLDPEIGGSNLAFGIDSGNYPNVRQLVVGINLSL
jgi:TonB-dependent starch-binding outer membrane protein SusC